MKCKIINLRKLENLIENNMVIRYVNLEDGTIGKEEYCLTFDEWKKIKKIIQK